MKHLSRKNIATVGQKTTKMIPFISGQLLRAVEYVATLSSSEDTVTANVKFVSQ